VQAHIFSRVAHNLSSFALMGKLVVHHFGPDPTTIGGMATVIRVLTKHQVGGDVVDSYSTWRPRSFLASARLAAAAARALRHLPVDHVAHIHLSERGSFLREGILVALAQRRGLVTVVTIHGASFIPFARRYSWLVSTVLRRTDLITCLDQETLDCVRRSAPDVPSTIVPNPVFVNDVFSGAGATDELIVFAGEIGLRKGADVLFGAWQLVAKRRRRARCVMVGPVNDFSPPTAERFEVRRPVDPIEMNELLRCARVIALPSRAEGMPMVLLEAMSLGRPFVSTPVGCIPELAGEGGMLVPVGDQITLADRLTDLLADPDLARMMGERGRRFILETRCVDVVGARLQDLYAEAATNKD
jgi:glycosyltransferase involved in cell wall biosynthesis